MRTSLLLGSSFSVALSISLVALAATASLGACSSDEDGASSGNPAGPDGQANADANPALDGGGFDGETTPTCIEAKGNTGDPAATRTLDDPSGTVTVTVTGTGCGRTFTLDSTATRRDDFPAGARTVAESESTPSVQTHNDLFDGLYQLALDEAKQNAVAEIHDYAFQNGNALPCQAPGCFETGRKWNYVWTRDTSYAADLGLGWLDAGRAASSLSFKLSTRRDGTDLQIVQDTGTGGSYPVSTDRVVWALGAREILAHLTGTERTAFRDRALEAIKNTLAHDRVVAFDPKDGLYRGEQSFLDWRSQTYPSWTVPDLAHIAQSKSLSTNVVHLVAMQTAIDLATESGDTAAVSELGPQATALRTAIRTRLWLDEDKQFSTFVTTALDPAPARRFDLLGTSLAVLEGVATDEQAKSAIASYPTLPHGPPVIFPQQKDTPIYHNRAIWPFVTAYWVKAAKKTGNDAAFDNGVRSLVRGAALNLSNMENLEVATGTPWHEEGATSGPVVNSQRQLWSVAGYVGMVNGSLFGVTAEAKGIRVAPFVTRGLRTSMFAASDSLVLNNLSFHGKKVSVVVHLPAAGANKSGAYGVGTVRINGAIAEGGFVEEAKLAGRNQIDVELTDGASAAATVKLLADVSDYRVLFGPKSPVISGVALGGGKITLGVDLGGESASDVTVSVYRDGTRVATDLPGTTTSWTDAASNGESSPSYCYALETKYASGNVSQRSAPACFWGSGTTRISTVDASGFTKTGGTLGNKGGQPYVGDWGNAGDEIAATFTAARSGDHLVQASYANGAGSLESGITCAVKHVTVEEMPAGTVVASGYLMMPQRATWDTWGDSSFVRATLAAGKTYRVRLSHDARAVNMSAFAHFAQYTGGTGGTGGAYFRVDVASLKLLSLAP